MIPSYLPLIQIILLASCASFNSYIIKPRILSPSNQFHQTIRATTTSSLSSNPSSTRYLDERNDLLFNQILNSTSFSSSSSPTVSGVNLTDIIQPWMNFYDESFDSYLSNQISLANTKETKEFYGKIRYEINMQRQQQLLQAQQLFQSLITLQDIQQIEAKLLYYLQRNEIQLPFMMILEMNLENAVVSKASQKIVELLSYIRTVVLDYQDNLVSKPLKLLRRLLRLDDSEERKNLLIKKLILPSSLPPEDGSHHHYENVNHPVADSDAVSQTAAAAQCEFIVLGAKPKEDLIADVTLNELEEAIDVIEEQFQELAARATGETEGDSAEDLLLRCRQIRKDLEEITD